MKLQSTSIFLFGMNKRQSGVCQREVEAKCSRKVEKHQEIKCVKDMSQRMVTVENVNGLRIERDLVEGWPLEQG